VLHATSCCRQCRLCGNGVPLGVNEHVCRKVEPAPESLTDDMKKPAF
jgi:hypothetical protein